MYSGRPSVRGSRLRYPAKGNLAQQYEVSATAMGEKGSLRPGGRPSRPPALPRPGRRSSHTPFETCSHYFVSHNSYVRGVLSPSH